MPLPEIHHLKQDSLENTKETNAVILSIPENFDSLEPAPTLHRVGAFLLDFSIIHSISLWGSQWIALFLLKILSWKNPVTTKLLSNEHTMELSFRYAVYLLWPIGLLFFGFAYYIISLSKWQTTLGKGIIGLRLIPSYGERAPISLQQLGRRYLASLCTLCSFGTLFFIGSNSYSGICFHDEASNTRVVRRNRKNSGEVGGDVSSVVSIQRAA